MILDRFITAVKDGQRTFATAVLMEVVREIATLRAEVDRMSSAIDVQHEMIADLQKSLRESVARAEKAEADCAAMRAVFGGQKRVPARTNEGQRVFVVAHMVDLPSCHTEGGECSWCSALSTDSGKAFLSWARDMAERLDRGCWADADALLAQARRLGLL
jgi:hypothetical protein